MGISGLGLGLVATSLTVCSQQTAAHSNVGAATALLQSLRTFGGMLGTVMTGALIGHLYSRGVHRSLDSYQATQWFKSFASPELLVDRAEQAALINRLVSIGHAGDAMMHSAREALVQSIHVGILAAGGAALPGLCLACSCRRCGSAPWKGTPTWTHRRPRSRFRRPARRSERRARWMPTFFLISVSIDI